MKYQFPTIRTIEDVLPHIEGHEEFRVFDKGWYLVVNYMVALEDTFPSVEVSGGSAKMRAARVLESAIRRECRGLIFDIAGNLISRPYHKFFNIGEKHETHLNRVNLNEPHVILEKLDGSMIRPIPLPEGSFRLATKAGVTDVAVNAEAFIADKQNYSQFIRKCIQKGTTPIFEWCSRNNRIVVDYPDDQLILTGVRSNGDGSYLDYSNMSEYAKAWGIPVVKAFAINKGDIKVGEKIEEFVEQIRKWEDSEGVVIRFDSGYMLKIKADDYVLRHKSKDGISQEKDVIDVILQDSVDDIVPLLTADDAARLQTFQKAFWLAVEDVGTTLHDIYRSLEQGQDQKEFAVLVTKETPKHHHSLMFSMRRGLPVKDLLVNHISKSLSTQTKVNEARWMFGDLSWNIAPSPSPQEPDPTQRCYDMGVRAEPAHYP